MNVPILQKLSGLGVVIELAGVDNLKYSFPASMDNAQRRQILNEIKAHKRELVRELQQGKCYKGHSYIDDGVPLDAVTLFPSMRHVPDLQGFGCPSDLLPEHLQIFGYWGYRVQFDKRGGIEMIKAANGSDNVRHCNFWLYHLYDGVKRDLTSWIRQTGKEGKNEGN